MMNTIPLMIAQAGEAASGTPTQGGSPFQMWGIMAIFLLVMYVMMIRPQRRRDKERREMLANIKNGCRVLLTSGIFGQVTAVKEQTLIVRIADNTKIEVVRAAISQIVEKGEVPSEIEPTK